MEPKCSESGCAELGSRCSPYRDVLVKLAGSAGEGLKAPSTEDFVPGSHLVGWPRLLDLQVLVRRPIHDE